MMSKPRKGRDNRYYTANKESIIIRNNNYRKDHNEQRLLIACRKRAKEKGLEFNLELEDIIIPEVCPYLGLPITNTVGEGKSKTLMNASIDRIDNLKGYVKDNIEVISTKANLMKHDVSVDQLVIFAENILKRHKQ